jgi:type IV pilus assembly protein PilO
MALLPSNKRDRILGAVGAVALLLGIAYGMLVWQPRREELVEMQLRVDSLLIINQRAKSELARGKTNELKIQADILTADLKVMRLLVPTENEVPSLLDQVSTAARRVGLEITDVQPLPTLVGDQYEAFKYRLVVRGGTYHQIADLLTNIGSLQRIVAPINVVLNPQADARVAKRAKMQNLEARFEIQTYVAHAPPPPPPVKGVAAKEVPKPGEQ